MQKRLGTTGVNCFRALGDLDYTRRAGWRHLMVLFYFIFFTFGNWSPFTCCELFAGVSQKNSVAESPSVLWSEKLNLSFNQHEGEQIMNFQFLTVPLMSVSGCNLCCKNYEFYDCHWYLRTGPQRFCSI